LLVYLILLQKLSESSLKDTDADGIRRFSMLFRGMIICTLINEDSAETFELISQGKDIVQMADSVTFN
jgi:hypothetical protein